MPPSRDIRIQNFNGLDFDLSVPLKVKSGNAIGLIIYYFLLMFNIMCSLTRLLYEILAFKICVTLNLTFHTHSRSNVILPSAYIISYQVYMCIPHLLAVTAIRKSIFFLIIRPKISEPTPTLTAGRYYQSLITSSLGQREGPHK